MANVKSVKLNVIKRDFIRLHRRDKSDIIGKPLTVRFHEHASRTSWRDLSRAGIDVEKPER